MLRHGLPALGLIVACQSPPRPVDNDAGPPAATVSVVIPPASSSLSSTTSPPDASAPDLTAAKLAVANAKAELLVAQRNRDRQKQLHDLGEPQRDLDQAQAEVDARARDLQQKEAALKALTSR